MDLPALRRVVESAIENYRYPRHDALSVSWSDERITTELAAMRAALCDPYWSEVELHDTLDQITAETKRRLRCIIVADDGRRTVLAFDPEGGEFLLAMRIEGSLATIGVRGDAVGCFMAS